MGLDGSGMVKLSGGPESVAETYCVFPQLCHSVHF